MENADTAMLTIKMFLFLAMEIAVVGMFAAVLFMGLYKLVQGKIRESRYLDQLKQEAQPNSSARHAA